MVNHHLELFLIGKSQEKSYKKTIPPGAAGPPCGNYMAPEAPSWNHRKVPKNTCKSPLGSLGSLGKIEDILNPNEVTLA